MHLAQTNTAVRTERRAFVRERHTETVRLVVDLDLFIRSLRRYIILGPHGGTGDNRKSAEVVEREWEGNLLKRLREIEYGHPDPDVREAAERMDDEMWPFTTTAQIPISSGDPKFHTPEGRKAVSSAVDAALQQFRYAVYAAPHRQVPDIRYDGAQRMPSTMRGLGNTTERETRTEAKS